MQRLEAAVAHSDSVAIALSDAHRKSSSVGSGGKTVVNHKYYCVDNGARSASNELSFLTQGHRHGR